MTVLTTSSIKKATLYNLPINELVSIKERMENYFWGAGVNIALHNVLTSKEAKKFRRKTKDAIKKQIDYFAKLDNISMKKSDSWLPFADAFDGGMLAIYAYLLFAGEKGGQSALNKMVPQHIFDLKNIKLKKQLGERNQYLVKTLDETGISWVSDILEKGREQGLRSTEIVNILRKEAKNQAEYRADMITETEAMYAMNLVEVETYKRNGIEKVTWEISGDERTCPICWENHEAGQVELGKEFPSGDISPLAHPQCRCFLLPVLPVTVDNIWTGL